jgi:hypothetical protein
VVAVTVVVVATVVVTVDVVFFGGLAGGLMDGPATAATAKSKPARPMTVKAAPVRR